MKAAFCVLLAMGLPACTRDAPSPPEPSASAPLPSASASPVAALDRLDTRAPVPLLPHMAAHQKENMRAHLVAVHEIVSAAASDDFPTIERAAAKLGSSERMGAMCTHMGAGAPGFTEQALAFHTTADGIGVAARARDKARVMAALASTLQACTSCHAAWKQEIVDDATFALRSTPASHPHERKN